jgi:serine/threonine protein phosphatase PrpC
MHLLCCLTHLPYVMLPFISSLVLISPLPLFSSPSLYLLSPSSSTSTFSSLCYVLHCTIAPNNPTKRNQDSFIMKNDVATSSLVIACFDGHGQFGHDVSKFCKVFMETTLVLHPLFLKDLHRAILDVTARLGTRMCTDIHVM